MIVLHTAEGKGPRRLTHPQRTTRVTWGNVQPPQSQTI